MLNGSITVGNVVMITNLFVLCTAGFIGRLIRPRYSNTYKEWIDKLVLSVVDRDQLIDQSINKNLLSVAKVAELLQIKRL